MEKLKKFCTELAEKFPWYDMENHVNAKIFAIETENENKEFWDTLNKVLEAHKTENPLRCVEVIDFVGRCNNSRQPEEITLAHFGKEIVANTVLPYFEEATKQEHKFSTLDLLILLDIKFEFPELDVDSIICQIIPENIEVYDLDKEQEFAIGYSYLYRQYEPLHMLFKELGVI